MPWFNVDDGFAFHHKVIKAGNSAVGLWTRAGAHCANQLTDGFVSTEIVAAIGTLKQAERLVAVGLWKLVDGGFQFHQWSDDNRNPTRVQVLADRAYNARKAALHRDPELLKVIRERDRSRCRYCGRLVDWGNRRGSSGATYDHVDPAGPNVLENLVVACRSCNSKKSDRTPEEARMSLLSPGSLGISSKDAGSGPEYLERSGSVPEQNQNETGTFLGPLHSPPLHSPPKEEKKTSSSSSRSRGTRIPEDFTVSPDMVVWARERTPHADGRLETEKFINYWQAKSGAGATKRDWPATWRNWMLNAEERAPRQQALVSPTDAFAASFLGEQPALRALPGGVS